MKKPEILETGWHIGVERDKKGVVRIGYAWVALPPPLNATLRVTGFRDKKTGKIKGRAYEAPEVDKWRVPIHKMLDESKKLMHFERWSITHKVEVVVILHRADSCDIDARNKKLFDVFEGYAYTDDEQIVGSEVLFATNDMTIPPGVLIVFKESDEVKNDKALEFVRIVYKSAMDNNRGNCLEEREMENVS